MADQATIFGSDQNQPTDPNKQQQSPTQDNPLAILVGEGRKYKTAEELAKAYIEADGFIEKLKSENADLREKTVGAKTIDDLLSRLQQRQEASAPDKGEVPNPSGLTADAIAKIVQDTVTGLETKKSREANLMRADAEMRKLFGDKAGEVFAKEASTPEKRQALMSLASVAPDQFVKLFNPGKTATGSQTDSGSSVNTAALADTNQSARAMDPGTKDFFDALRRKEPKRYYSAEVQLAMHKAAQADPDKFFGRK